MKRIIALVLTLVLVLAMLPAVDAAAPEQTMALTKADLTLQPDLSELKRMAQWKQEAELTYLSGGYDLIVPDFGMYGMTVLAGESMKLRCELDREEDDSDAVILVYEGYYEDLDENSELVAAGTLPSNASGSWYLNWDTTGCAAGDYTVYFAIIGSDEQLRYASVADVFISDVEIPLERIGLYVLELGMETDTVYMVADGGELMTVHPVRYPYHTTDRRNIIISGFQSSSVGNFYGEDGRGVGRAPGSYTISAYINENGVQSYLSEMNVIVEELNENHPLFYPENGYINICPGVDYPIQVKLPEGKTLEDALLQTSRPGLLEAWAEGDTLYVRTLVEWSSLNKLVISFGQYYDTIGFYIREHDYRTEWVHPTCTEDGVKAKVCIHCGDVLESEVLPKLGHLVMTQTVITEPKATKDGIAAGHCSRCDLDVELPVSRIFTDTEPDWFYSDPLDYCYENGIINGIDEHTFGPTLTLNRAQLVTMLYRHAGSPEVTEAPAFTDVPEGQFYTAPVAWASANGIVMGYEDGTFRPGDAITREQIVTMLYRYVVMLEKDNGERNDLSAFADLDMLHEYALEPMQWAVANGVINGLSETVLGPQESTNRAQTVTILYRIITGVLTEE